MTAFGESTNARLREVADSFLDLSSDPDQFLIRPYWKQGASTKHAVTPSNAMDDIPDLQLDQPASRSSGVRGRRSARPASSLTANTPAEEQGGSDRKIRVTY